MKAKKKKEMAFWNIHVCKYPFYEYVDVARYVITEQGNS